MPIFDQGYQHWQGRLSGHAWRWLAVARHGIRVQLRGKLVRFLLLAAWVPAVALVVVLALWGLIEQGSESVLGFLKPLLPTSVVANPAAFRNPVWTIAYSTFFKFELFFIMLLVVVAGPNLISRDLRFNALPLYLSRPLTRLDYFLGKLGVIAALVAAVAVLPAVGAYLLGVCFSLDLGVIRDTWRLLPASILYGLVIVASAGTLMLALSSLSRRSLYVGIAWVGLWLVSSTVAGVLLGLQQAALWQQALREERAATPREQAGKDGAPRDRAGAELEADWPGDGPRRDRRGPPPAIARAQQKVEKALAEAAPTNWRSLPSYTANLERVGEQLLGTDAAWVQVARGLEPPQPPLGGILGGLGFGKKPPPPDERRFANRFVPQFPWTWSAAVLAGLLGLSLWVLSMRVKSLDRLR
jgi:ABC-type transport system involved in multi-copper enzyme maturation permease subunit